MSQAASPPTLRSTWTPRYNKAANEKIFQERLELIKKWYSAWNDGQRWELVEFVLLNLSDTDLHYIHSLLDPLMPRPPPPPPPPIRQDFTRIFPRHLSLKIFSCLDPRTLCRAAQVS
jgi:F-box protein 16